MVQKHLGVVFSVEFVLVSVRKANLFEGKLSSNSGFLVLEQSC